MLELAVLQENAFVVSVSRDSCQTTVNVIINTLLTFQCKTSVDNSVVCWF